MVSRVCLLAGLAAPAVAREVSEATVTPIAKVISLMEDMHAKAIAEKESEATKYSAFNQWCGDQTRIKNNEIEKGAREIEALEATIEKAAAKIRGLTDRIEELDEDVGRWTKDKKSAADVRDKEAVDFKATVLDYTESIDALNGAIAVLKKQAYSRSQAEEALVQVSSRRLVPAEVKSTLASFVQRSAGPDEMLLREAPEAYGYDFQSGGVVEMLQKLEDEFSTKKAELIVEERTAKHGFEQITQQLTDSTENANHEISQKTTLRGETQKSKAEAEGDLAQTQKDKKEDEEYLASMTALCQQKASDFESRQKLREEEIAAIAKATEIISSSSVAGSGDKHLPALLAQGDGVALAHLRSGQSSPLQSQAAAFLTSRAESSGSRLLSEAARQLSQGPFDKVKKLIKDLISQLMEEATQETEHKGWCDAELATNKQTRESRTEDVNTLSSNIESLTADIAQLTQDVADLSSAIKELDEAMASQTEERASSKATNEQTIKEAKEAQVAVQQALAVLKEFYAKASQATALVQTAAAQPSADAPETFDKPYTGMMPEGGGVVDFLEVVLSDFARLESETATSEASELEQFKSFMFESKKDKALKEGEIKHKSETKVNKESELHSAEAELKASQEQLDKAQAYYEKLKPSCVDSGITYEERVKRREEEIDSLKEALKILQGQDLPTLA
eukprot:TRINITY_DN722_c0_g1_i4.p1 TRINITY_DN722_c0_g1~~TRINITY_DN722_c0_g1_i4.p1  ORF type:complete len:681 (+),score=202.93 TRINITY_DN722_c0_g1_i4:48-2090(+)